MDILISLPFVKLNICLLGKVGGDNAAIWEFGESKPVAFVKFQFFWLNRKKSRRRFKQESF